MGSMRATRRRVVAGGVVVVALLAVAGGRAQAGSVYVHSATSGTFAGGWLTLHGIGHDVTWVTSSCDTGVIPLTRVQKRLFARGGSATGVLDIPGRRGGRKFPFGFTGMRYSAARDTVSYRAARLSEHKGASNAATKAVPRSFGVASLSVAPGGASGGSKLGASPGSPGSLGGVNGGHDCEMDFDNATDFGPNGSRGAGNPVQLLSASQWSTDNWNPNPDGRLLDFGDGEDFTSDGGFLRGCEDTTVWQFVPRCFVGGNCGPSGTFTFTIEWDWSWDAVKYTCTSSNPQYTCVDATSPGGVINWSLQSVTGD
jgi:hypothetical protein